MKPKHIVASSITLVNKEGEPRITLRVGDDDYASIFLMQKDGDMVEINGYPDGSVALRLQSKKSSTIVRPWGISVTAEDGTPAVRLGRIGEPEGRSAISLNNGSHQIFRVVAEPEPKVIFSSSPPIPKQKKKARTKPEYKG